MSAISQVSGALSNDYTSLASGRRINSAADDAAGLAIAQQENLQANGYDVGADNMASARDALNIADGALGSVTDYLQRIRELALHASNTMTVSDDDRAAMQKEVDGLLQGIEDVANYTSFNTHNLLDGSKDKFELATDSNGNSMSFTTGNATLQALGMEGFDLTGDFDISVIDEALSKVSEARSSAGAQTNALEYGMRYNSMASYTATSAQSRIEDLDYAAAISEKKKNDLLLEYSLYMQKEKQEQEKNKLSVLF